MQQKVVSWFYRNVIYLHVVAKLPISWAEHILAIGLQQSHDMYIINDGTVLVCDKKFKVYHLPIQLFPSGTKSIFTELCHIHNERTYRCGWLYSSDTPTPPVPPPMYSHLFCVCKKHGVGRWSVLTPCLERLQSCPFCMLDSDCCQLWFADYTCDRS